MIEEIWQDGGTGNNEILTLPRIPSGRAQHTFPSFPIPASLSATPPTVLRRY